MGKYNGELSDGINKKQKKLELISTSSSLTSLDTCLEGRTGIEGKFRGSRPAFLLFFLHDIFIIFFRILLLLPFFLEQFLR